MPLSKIKCRQKTKGQVSKASFLSFKKLFFLSAVILTFSESSPLFARKVTLPVHGLMVASPTPVPIEVEWDENWFLQSKTSEYNHKIARIAVLLSEISYVLVEKNPESNEMLRTYRELGFKDSDIEWNYILDYTAKDSGNNQVAFSFAKKIIQSNEGSKTLILAALRGTPLSANEWISNINISDSTHKNVAIHEGFEKTATNHVQFFENPPRYNVVPSKLLGYRRPIV